MTTKARFVWSTFALAGMTSVGVLAAIGVHHAPTLVGIAVITSIAYWLIDRPSGPVQQILTGGAIAALVCIALTASRPAADGFAATAFVLCLAARAAQSQRNTGVAH
jgi:hypothetical protein